jgi:type II secretory pathway pseudopilin PulG
MSAGRAQAGFTYVAALVLVATMGAVLAAFGELASHAAQREKERELLFIGHQFRQAIASYYRKEQRYPKALAELLEDKRYPMPVRHLRRIYSDPLTGSPDWGLVEAPQGGIMGVHSKSEEQPVKSGAFAVRDAGLEGAKSYSEWRFAHVPGPTGLFPSRERAKDR